MLFDILVIGSKPITGISKFFIVKTMIIKTDKYKE